MMMLMMACASAEAEDVPQCRGYRTFSRRGSMRVGRCGGDSEYTCYLDGPAGADMWLFSAWLEMIFHGR